MVLLYGLNYNDSARSLTVNKATLSQRILEGQLVYELPTGKFALVPATINSGTKAWVALRDSMPGDSSVSVCLRGICKVLFNTLADLITYNSNLTTERITGSVKARVLANGTVGASSLTDVAGIPRMHNGQSALDPIKLAATGKTVGVSEYSIERANLPASSGIPATAVYAYVMVR